MSGQLVGRGQQVDTFEAILHGRRHEKLVRVHGVPGVGKSRLLREFGALADDAGWSAQSVDLETLELGREGSSLPDRLASTVFRLLTADHDDAVRQPRRAVLDNALSIAARELAADRPNVNIKQTAALGGHIDNVTINVTDARVADQAALIRYRKSIISALTSALDGLDLSRTVVVFDSCEVMVRLSASKDSDSTNLARWFELDLLGCVLEVRLSPILVIAASEPFGTHTPTPGIDLELLPWTPAESRAFATDLGLPSDTADALAQSCDGLPLWANLLGEACLKAGERAVDATWLQQVAASGPAEEWVPRAFLNRIPDEDHDAIAAAAVLRNITFEAVEATVPSSTQSDWVRLTNYSFVRTNQDLGGRTGRKLHGLLGRAIRAYLLGDRPRYLQALHLRAAEYYDLVAYDVEAHYHRFCAGDWTRLDEWVETCRDLLDEFEYEKLLVHLGAADAVMEGLAVGADNARLKGLVYEWRAMVAHRRDQVDSAIELAELAAAQYGLTDSHGDHCDALDLLAGLHFRTAQVEAGIALLKRSLHYARQAGDDVRTGRALKRLARRADSRGESQRLLRDAHQSFKRGGDEHRIAETLRSLGDLESDLPRRRELYEEAAAVFAGDDACRGGKGEAEESLALLELDQHGQDGVRAHLLRAEEYFREVRSGSDRGRVLRALAHVALLGQNFDQAKGYLEEALVAFESARDMVEVASTYQTLAEATADWLGVRQAQGLLENAFETYRAISDIHGIAKVKEAVGRLQARQKTWPSERSSFTGALDGYRVAKDVRAQIRVLRALGASAGEFSAIADVMYTEISETRKYEAMTYLSEAYDLSIGVAPENLADLAFLMGQLHLYQHRHAAAWERFIEAEGLLYALPQVRNRAVVRRQMAALHFAEGEIGSAIEVCLRAIGALDRVRHADILAYLHQDVGDYLSVLGRTSEAEENYRIARECFDAAY